MSLVSERGDFTKPAGEGGDLERIKYHKRRTGGGWKEKKKQGKINSEPEKQRQKEKWKRISKKILNETMST